MKLNLSICFVALSMSAAACGGDDPSPKEDAKPGIDSPNRVDGGAPDVDDAFDEEAPSSDASVDEVPVAPVLARTKGIGRPCATDTECEPGQECRVDTNDYVGHGQCTVTCSSSEACESEFGEETMCIGAEICVARCLTDSDCPEQTECIGAGWCKRQGTGSGVPSCTGVSTPCSLLSGSSCSAALGCYDDSGCNGVSRGCYSQYSSYSCNSVDGCYWSSSGSGSCSGVSRSCTGYVGELSCGGQPGCRWDEGCAGTPLSCADLTVSACSSQPGCSLKFD